MENRPVKIISNVDATIGINDPQLRFTRTWEKRGTVRTVDLDTLRELCYNPGTNNLFVRGILVIEDMNIKKKDKETNEIKRVESSKQELEQIRDRYFKTYQYEMNRLIEKI